MSYVVCLSYGYFMKRVYKYMAKILNRYFVYVPRISHYTMQHPFPKGKMLSVWNWSWFEQGVGLKRIMSTTNYYTFSVITLVHRSKHIP